MEARHKKFAISLTFQEVVNLNEMVRERLKNDDYGFGPILHIVFETPDAEFPEYQEVKACCVHDIAEEYTKAKEENRKPKLLELYKDVTDTDKADFI